MGIFPFARVLSSRLKSPRAAVGCPWPGTDFRWPHTSNNSNPTKLFLSMSVPQHRVSWRRAGESPFSLRSVMNRFAQKVVSGGLAAGLSAAVVMSADAQQARSGVWTQNAPEGEWHMTGRDHSLQRFSPLRQITTSNVGDLRPVWSFSTGTLRGHEGNPLVVGNVMYVNTSRTSCTPSTCRSPARR
jgi:glucose dehydrogenase